VTCFLLFFLSFLVFLVGVDMEIVLIFILILLIRLSLPLFMDFLEVNTGNTDSFNTFGIRPGLLRISMIRNNDYFAFFGSRVIKRVVRKIGRS
jgi:hypothetical protein